MGKIDFEFRSKSSQSSIGCIQQRICEKIIHGAEPFALENAPQGLCDIQMGTIWRQKEDEFENFLTQNKAMYKFLHINKLHNTLNKRSLK